MRNVLIAMMMMLAVTAASQAELLMYDGQAYDVGAHPDDDDTWTGSVDGTKFTGGGLDVTYGDNNTVVTGSLSYPGLQAGTGNAMEIVSGASWWNYSVDLQPTTGVGGSGSVYASFLINFSNLGSLTTSNEEELYDFGNLRWEGSARLDSTDPTKFNLGFGVMQGSTQVFSPKALATGEDHLVVVYRNYDDNSYGIWVNPTELGGTAPTADATGTDGNTNTFSRALFYSNFDGGTDTSSAYVFDEVRIGETYADVTPIPEPATMSLLALGGAAIIRRKRR